LLIPEYGINGAAMATAISILLFNVIRFIIIKVKMNIQPFSVKTIYTVLLLFGIFFLLYFLPNSGRAFLDIIWRSLAVLLIFIPLGYYLNLSEDINKFIIEIRKKYF
ncbi:MAG: polysaccharide biosynthesis C-terminal domain-containing protein, partial [Proteobacteria bacterium]|nr:polysaccharide biosynthesis C-terminal domain-containing protein [Pseudomonadota bacterium]